MRTSRSDLSPQARTFGTLAPDVKAQPRILWESQPIPPFLFVAHPRVPHAVAEKVKKAMLEMDRDPRGRDILKSLNMHGLDRVTDADFDVFNKMGFKFSTSK